MTTKTTTVTTWSSTSQSVKNNEAIKKKRRGNWLHCSVNYFLWSGSCLAALCSLWNPSQCKTACRYPHPAGPVIQTLNPLTDCFRWVRPQHQLAAATDSWFVPDFMVQERPTPLSARGITSRTNGITYASGNSCGCCPLLSTAYTQQAPTLPRSKQHQHN